MNKYSMSNKLKILIITCWVVYIICLIIKLCGGNRFEIATTNQRFIDVCNYIDNNLWLKMIIATIIYVISTYIIYLGLTKQKLFKDLWIIPILIGINLINIYPASGLVTIQAQKNNVDVPGLLTSGTVTTATTEVNTLPITGYIRVFCSEAPVTLTLVNTGVAITVSNVSLTIDYED